MENSIKRANELVDSIFFTRTSYKLSESADNYLASQLVSKFLKSSEICKQKIKKQGSSRRLK